MLNWFEMVKSFYPRFWNEKMVGDAVVCKKITAEQYKEITGLDYVDPTAVPESVPEETEVK